MALEVLGSVAQYHVHELEYEGVINNLTVVRQENGDNLFRVRFLALTSDYLDGDAILEFGNTLAGKELRWRHQKLEDKPEAFLGQVDEVELETTTDGKVNLWAEVFIYRDTDEQERVIKEIENSIKEGKPIGDSVGYIKITNNEDKIVRVFFRELSVTPYPKCKECRVVTKGSLECENLTQVETLIQAMEEPKIPEKNGGSTISAEAFEEFRVKSKALEDVLKSKIEELEKENRESKKQIVELGVTKEQFESKLRTLERDRLKMVAEVKKLESKNKTLEDKNQKLMTIPLRMRIAQMEGLSDPRSIKTRIRELENETPGSLKNSLKTARAIRERMEMKMRLSNRNVRVGTTNNIGGKPRSEENELNDLSPIQLAEKHYGV